ncbi:hypothetical protein PBY51_016528 [Eleginops maclovinus]|uniref:Protein kinase domain-containing protein n=1 Tax=Eleginops maclovinus TaxID=56733 RepID=A0AAN7W781_ELEMC|nr:hypothetical protein PBY51_016528 [Eleginops maclovinus]
MEGLLSLCVRICCCCEEEEEDRKEEPKEEVKMKQQSFKSSCSSLPLAECDGPPPAFWFSTLQVRPPRHQRGRRSSEWGDSPLSWKPGLRFGASQSYLSLEKLGEGANACVYKGVSRINGQLVALKEIRMKTEEGVPFTAIREASLLKALKHANIVVLHDIVHTRDTLTLVFEYMQTDLGQYMSEHQGGLNSHNVRLLLFQLLRGLLFLHSQRVLHRDLKPPNLLLSFRGELKIADFGLARSQSVPGLVLSSEVVTLWYRPPDVLLGNTEYSSSLDIWGAGCIFVEMLQGAPAFPGERDRSGQLQEIWTVLGVPSEASWPGVCQLPEFNPERFLPSQPQKLRNVWKRLQQLPGKTEDLLDRMLKPPPLERISAQEALLHPYFHTLPPPIMHLGDTTSIFKVPGLCLEAEVRAGRRSRPSLLHRAPRW